MANLFEICADKEIGTLFKNVHSTFFTVKNPNCPDFAFIDWTRLYIQSEPDVQTNMLFSLGERGYTPSGTAIDAFTDFYDAHYKVMIKLVGEPNEDEYYTRVSSCFASFTDGSELYRPLNADWYKKAVCFKVIDKVSYLFRVYC
jgi:hypothetical protein